MTEQSFGILANGGKATLYKLRCGKLEAAVTDFGATLVSLWVPDRDGNVADVVLGFSEAAAYGASGTYFGATVSRNANRIGGAAFSLGGKTYPLAKNDNGNNIHSGSDSHAFRLWNVAQHTENTLVLTMNSPDGDQGFPGNAEIQVTYALEAPATLRITYEGICDADTIFNLTNHSYFNLAGHDHPERAMSQTLCMGARIFTAADHESIPTGELRSVEGSPMDFRRPKPIGRDIDQDYDALNLQGGYDHNFEAYGDPCAVLTDPLSGRMMQVRTDCPGIQFYTGNYLNGEIGKEGVVYTRRGGICLETQYYPDAVNHPEWKQPVVKAGERYHSETEFIFL